MATRPAPRIRALVQQQATETLLTGLQFSIGDLTATNAGWCGALGAVLTTAFSRSANHESEADQVFDYMPAPDLIRDAARFGNA
jgi:hypothetical protein